MEEKNVQVKENQQVNNTQLEGNSTQAEKTFTQEEVNRIVSDRLSRERAKSEPTEEERRLADLEARENKLSCQEFIGKQNYPQALLGIFDTSNVDDFKNNVNKLLKAFPIITEPIGNIVHNTGNSVVTNTKTLDDIFKPKI